MATVTRRQRDNVTILDVVGKLTLGSGDPLRHELAAIGIVNVLINLARVSSIDSSGVGELVMAHASIGRAGGKVKLVKLPPKGADILRQSGIDVFEVFDDEDKALRSF